MKCSKLSFPLNFPCGIIPFTIRMVNYCIPRHYHWQDVDLLQVCTTLPAYHFHKLPLLQWSYSKGLLPFDGLHPQSDWLSGWFLWSSQIGKRYCEICRQKPPNVCLPSLEDWALLADVAIFESNPVRTILSHNDQKPTISRRVSFIFHSLPNTKEINMEEKKENVMD